MAGPSPTPVPERAPTTLPNAFAIPATDVLEALESSPEGLSESEAQRRLEVYGPNALEASKPTSVWKILGDQLKSVVVALLFVAALIAFVLGDPLDAAAIGVVLVINTLLGFVTELRARRAMEALLRLEAPRATVVREGVAREIAATDVVPGDILEIEAGQAAAADLRVLVGNELRTNEAALTGESLPVDKRVDPVSPDAPLPDRTSMIFKGTTIVAGSGRAIAVATGMATELGKIGGLVAGIQEERTPLEHRLDELGRRLVWLALGVAAIVVVISILQGEPLGRMIETGIALAIAAVPEGLPAVATITLAVGVRRMAKRRALIRRLPVVESLGAATVICTDKTGTLTAGEMTLTTLWIADREIHVTGAGYEPRGEFSEDGRRIEPREDEILTLALKTGLLSSHGDAVQTESGWTARGDPTDVAVIVAARKAGLDRDTLEKESPQVAEVPFSSERMFTASFHAERDGRLVAYAKGAPGRIIERCARILTPSGERPLDDDGRDHLLEKNAELAGRGLRVLALATATVPAAEEAALDELTFLALVGLIDPPAQGVKETVRLFREAGIRTVMLTGDQRLTAEAIARDLGVLQPGEATLDGRDLSRMTEAELAEKVGNVAVFCRVSPEDKLKIVTAYQGHGEIVAMLGDGVNDAAALKKANIGVAMGIRGTDAAKEASAVVLQDDRFQTIASAVEEGRVIFENIRKFVFYLFSCNVAEILVLLIAGIVGLPTPLLPLQILWLNLVTDTFPALALALEPAEGDIMRQEPRDPKEAILSIRFLRIILFYGALITGVTLAAYLWSGAERSGITIAFMTLALAQIFHLGNARSAEPVLKLEKIFSNPYAIAAVIFTFGLQLLALYWTPLATVLRLTPLSLREWSVVLPLAIFPAVVGQLLKALKVRQLASP